ncbi:MAG: hypothetical protein ACI8UO_003574 [Verrucomicrobiales bacterium]|jgi:hypothetical protein
MTLPATVEEIEGERFRAATTVTLPLSAEATSREKALDALREEVTKHVSDEEIIIKSESPWEKFSGIWIAEADEDFDQYWAQVQLFRRELDHENQMGEFATED